MDYETEEQQLEAIKKWWKENSTMVIGGVAIGIASIFGWQTYQSDMQTHSEQASVLYEQVLTRAQNTKGLNEQLVVVNQLAAEFSDTPYASLSALLLAKQQVDNGQPIKAQQQYQWVIENASQGELKYLAKIRLSRLLLGTNRTEQALLILNEVYPESFQAMALELKGDALLIQGNTTQAKQAYTQAKSLSDGSNRWLQLKIDDIADDVTTATTNEAAEPTT